MKNSLSGGRKLAFAALAVCATLSLSIISTGCAGIFARDIETVSVLKSERLYLSFAPLDSVVVAELTRAGVDPVKFADELEAEIRYRLYMRGQEESQDSATATVAVLYTIHRLQPGTGNAGTFASYSLVSKRPKHSKAESVEWTAQGRSKDNVPVAFMARHLARQAADDVVARLQPPKDNEPPPPLQLMR